MPDSQVFQKLSGLLILGLGLAMLFSSLLIIKEWGTALAGFLFILTGFALLYDEPKKKNS